MSSALLYTYFLVILRDVFCIVNKASAHNKLVIVDGSTAFPLLEAQFVLFPIRSSPTRSQELHLSSTSASSLHPQGKHGGQAIEGWKRREGPCGPTSGCLSSLHKPTHSPVSPYSFIFGGLH